MSWMASAIASGRLRQPVCSRQHVYAGFAHVFNVRCFSIEFDLPVTVPLWVNLVYANIPSSGAPLCYPGQLGINRWWCVHSDWWRASWE